jgi:hypothetical protein
MRTGFVLGVWRLWGKMVNQGDRGAGVRLGRSLGGGTVMRCPGGAALVGSSQLVSLGRVSAVFVVAACTSTTSTPTNQSASVSAQPTQSLEATGTPSPVAMRSPSRLFTPPPSLAATASPRPSLQATEDASALPLRWTEVELPATSAYEDEEYYPVANDVVAGNPGFVAVGGFGDYGSTYGGWIWVSSDGLSWEAIQDADIGPSTNIDRVVHWRGGLVAGGSSIEDGRGRAAFWSSTDGIDWQGVRDRSAFTFYRHERLEYYGGRIVALLVEGDQLVAAALPDCDCEVRSGAVVWRTSDGVEWTRDDLTAEELPPGAAIPGGDGWLRVSHRYSSNDFGDPESAIETSTDQQAWRVVYRGMAVSDLAAFGEGFIAVGRSGLVTSSDGLTWTTAGSFAPGTALEVAAADGRIVAVGQSASRPAAFVTNSP